jgi:hypothetical protein
MRVLPRGSKINSAGWNKVVDAWNQMVRFYSALRSSGFDAPKHIKLLQLIANDQFRWGANDGKLMPADVYVFEHLTRTGIIDQMFAGVRLDFDSVFAECWIEMSTRTIPQKRIKTTYCYWQSHTLVDHTPEEQAEIRKKDQKCCTAQHWSGGFCKLWVSERVHERVDMICGCAVPPMFLELGKELGWYGSHGWIGSSSTDDEKGEVEGEVEDELSD